ncbi:MAG: CBS domain-containing protein [Chloroflexota bacterium]
MGETRFEGTSAGSPGRAPVLVRDLMTVGVPTCAPETPLADIARFFVERGLEAVVVLNPADGHALGVVSQEDLVRAYAHPQGQSLTAEQIMRDGMVQAPPDIPLAAAAQIMQDNGVRALFLVHHSGGIEYPAAMITYQHILRHMAARDREELRDLGMHAERQSPLETFIQRREAARSRNLRQS